MSRQPFYGKRPHPLLWAGSRTVREKVTVSGIPNRRHNCVIFIVYTIYKCGLWRAAGWRPMFCMHTRLTVNGILKGFL
jgi:hypothetical protein